MTEEKGLKDGVVQIEDAELVLYLAGGAQVAVQVSPVQLDLFMRGTGMQISLADDGEGIMIDQYSDEDVEQHIIPRLPKIE